EERDVATSHGRTHVVVSGPEDAPPVVLLHGAGCSAAMWVDVARALSPRFRTYALDTIGDVGRSVATPGAAPRDLDGYADWLLAVLDALGLERPAIVSHSYGGWVALGFASRHPARVRRLVTCAPAASLARIQLRFFIRTVPAFFIRWPSMIRWMLDGISARGPEMREHVIGRICEAIAKHGYPISVYPTLIAPARLGQITAPTLVMIGAREILYDPATALGVARASLPNVQAVEIAGASHAVTYDAAEEVCRRAREFLELA
ncbi:MAG: alpha/beta hydrolase, partial [Myxococcales bacterium]|nr:alpha/beta hydrolase [Myxococcales bacterium]